MPAPLTYYPLTHGGLRKIIHPRLGVEIDNQTAVRYLRFIDPVRIDYLELPRSVYGRWVPAVPTHPAHLSISVPDDNARRWRVVREADLPYDPRTAGEGLSQEMPLEAVEAHFAAILRDPPARIDLGGLGTRLLRVECDREHPVWPSHGECNGSPFSVPFGILDPLRAYGEGGDPLLTRFRHLPLLTLADLRPAAPNGMTCERTALGLFFYGERFSIGFSLKRPQLVHLGWDILAQGQAAHNRLKADNASAAALMGLSGPLLAAFDQDYGSQHWTGEVSVVGNSVEYRRLHAVDGLEIDARFSVSKEGVAIELTQRCTADIPALEAETWRLAWDLKSGMTATAGLPTLASGRNGRVSLPLAFASDGVGCLSCRASAETAGSWLAQAESYRNANSTTCGFAPAEQFAGADEVMRVPQGERRLSLDLRVDSFKPAADVPSPAPRDGLSRHWGSMFACFRPEYRGFSNNAASVNCHQSQLFPIEMAARTAPPEGGPDPFAMGRFTIERAILDGGGYGYWRSLYLDSDPILVTCAGRLHQVRPDSAWLKRIEPGLREAVARLLGNIDSQGLLVCRALSGNSGSFRWSSNAADVVGFGHHDAYINALAYRALRNAAAMCQDLGDGRLAADCREAAARLKDAYPSVFLNPATGWLAGWRSRDGALHDYGFVYVNAPAIAFGLLPDAQARTALHNLERARSELNMGDATLGIPMNLLPIDPADHLVPRIWKQPHTSFEVYTDGSLMPFFSACYLRALALYGSEQAADALARQLDAGLAAGYCNGGIGSGVECRSWDGVPNGYEGTLCGNFGSVYALAIQQGVHKPLEPEWWPAGG